MTNQVKRSDQPATEAALEWLDEAQLEAGQWPAAVLDVREMEAKLAKVEAQARADQSAQLAEAFQRGFAEGRKVGIGEVLAAQQTQAIPKAEVSDDR